MQLSGYCNLDTIAHALNVNYEWLFNALCEFNAPHIILLGEEHYNSNDIKQFVEKRAADIQAHQQVRLQLAMEI